MTIVLKTEWPFIDGTTDGHTKVKVGPGGFEVERISNPYGHNAAWLVLKGTKTGMAEGAMREWQNGKTVNNPNHPDHGKPVDWGDMEIIIKE